MHRQLFMPLALLALSMPAVAQAQAVPPLKLSKPIAQGMKGKKIAILSYSINFVTSQRASANASMGVKARAGATLAGVDQNAMRKLANEAHADLKTRLTAAGIAVVDDEAVSKAAKNAGVTLLPGNIEENRDGGMVIGSGVKKAYVSVGADVAPLTDLYQSGGKVGGFAMLATMGKSGKLNTPSVELGASFVSPSLTIDFADADAKTSRTLAGSKRASVDIDTQFAIRLPSPVNVQTGAAKGLGTPSTMMLAKDVVIDGTFTGSKGASTMSTAGDYGDWNPSDASNVIVDLPSWTAMVQSAYRAYNAAIVANLASAVGG